MSETLEMWEELEISKAYAPYAPYVLMLIGLMSVTDDPFAGDPDKAGDLWRAYRSLRPGELPEKVVIDYEVAVFELCLNVIEDVSEETLNELWLQTGESSWFNRGEAAGEVWMRLQVSETLLAFINGFAAPGGSGRDRVLGEDGQEAIERLISRLKARNNNTRYLFPVDDSVGQDGVPGVAQTSHQSAN